MKATTPLRVVQARMITGAGLPLCAFVGRFDRPPRYRRT
jgi:hypothetical protein